MKVKNNVLPAALTGRLVDWQIKLIGQSANRGIDKLQFKE
jgi:hypothetical protein